MVDIKRKHEIAAKYRTNNKEKIAAANKEYRERPEVRDRIMEQKRAYYLENKGFLVAANKANYWANKPRYHAQSKQWAQDNPEKVRETQKKFRDANPGKYNDVMYAWRRDNPDKISAIQSRYRTKNAGKILAGNAKRRAAKLDRTPAYADMGAIELFYECCPADCHVDHVIPLQGGNISGLHLAENLQWLPNGENLSKGNRFSL